MKIDENRDREYLLRILEHCQRIEDACERFGNNYEAFSKDADFQDVICMNIFQIGELSNLLSEETKEQYKELPWHQMYGIRNIMAHAYTHIENKIIWDTVVIDIPKLKQTLR